METLTWISIYPIPQMPEYCLAYVPGSTVFFILATDQFDPTN
ncbi:MAG: hypothetical protein NW224_26975 [Leptolyngbyaceae cyanobacterium bins.302]|nr:hypothetical protein [Leptolyngbyaceae cyanobacterium bins.302]